MTPHHTAELLVDQLFDRPVHRNLAYDMLLFMPPRQRTHVGGRNEHSAARLAFFAQFSGSGGPTAGGAQSGPSIPDISGAWSHPSIPGFEPLSSGPTSVVNKSRLRSGPQAGTGNVNMLVGDYTNPILKPKAAEIVKKHGEIQLSGVGYPDPRNQCTPQAVPYVFTSGGIQVLQKPEKITILYDYDHQVRRIRINQAHPSHVKPSWYGDSVRPLRGRHTGGRHGRV